ncbi:MAG: GNAT family N-acetyltransferase [Desulfobacterales bacterium]|nr:GNAT family N-acetyltransferase [Desulfobacterales bacterium]
MEIRQARTKTEIEDVRRLFREYESFLDVDLCFQSFEEELAGLPGKYTPPGGGLLIAVDGERTVGCVAVRQLSPEICEMKRLYVKPEARGTGLGRALARQIVETAKGIGYSKMRLDTLGKLRTARRIYTSMGFKETIPYYENPIPGVVYMELALF